MGFLLEDLFSYVLFTVILVIIKVILDRVGLKVYPIMASKIKNGDKSTEGSIKAFRYVYRSQMNSKVNQVLFGLVGPALLSLFFVYRDIFGEGVLFYQFLLYIIYVIIVEVGYAVRVYNMSK